jgi:hypothetical protein
MPRLRQTVEGKDRYWTAVETKPLSPMPLEKVAEEPGARGNASEMEASQKEATEAVGDNPVTNQ